MHRDQSPDPSQQTESPAKRPKGKIINFKYTPKNGYRFVAHATKAPSSYKPGTKEGQVPSVAVIQAYGLVVNQARTNPTLLS